MLLRGPNQRLRLDVGKLAFFPPHISFACFLSENMDGFVLVLLISRVSLRLPEATMLVPSQGTTVTSLVERWVFLPSFQQHRAKKTVDRHTWMMQQFNFCVHICRTLLSWICSAWTWRPGPGPNCNAFSHTRNCKPSVFNFDLLSLCQRPPLFLCSTGALDV